MPAEKWILYKWVPFDDIPNGPIGEVFEQAEQWWASPYSGPGYALTGPFSSKDEAKSYVEQVRGVKQDAS